MRLWAAWRVLVFLGVSLEASQLQIGKPYKELLRHHQANRRPAFIDRKFVDLRKQPDPVEVIEKDKPATLIRHGRSRNHFARFKDERELLKRSRTTPLSEPLNDSDLADKRVGVADATIDDDYSKPLNGTNVDSRDKDTYNENDSLNAYHDDEQRNITEFVGVDSDTAYDFDSSDERNATERKKPDKQSVQTDIVTRFLRIIENQHLLGENCTAGTDLNLGEGVVDLYAQERFRLEAEFAVNRANMLTRLWKYAPDVMQSSEYLLHASVLSMVEFDEDIFAAGNCYDKLQYLDRWLYCPFAHRLPDQEGVLVKDLAIEYKYLSNSSEFFWIARKNAERVIANQSQFSHGETAFDFAFC